MASSAEDDLQAATTEGFKVGEKKTVEEYTKLGRWSLTHRLSLSIAIQHDSSVMHFFFSVSALVLDR